jgi:hypothetical protein
VQSILEIMLYRALTGVAHAPVLAFL